MAPRDAAPRVQRRSDYRPPAFLVDALTLHFDLAPNATRVIGRFGYRRNPQAAPGQALTLNGEQQRLIRVVRDGRELSESDRILRSGSLVLPEPGDEGTLEIESEIDPGGNTALEGLYLSSGAFCTQCEPEGFRRITYFPDRPDVLARYRVTLVAERARFPVLLSNGNLSAQGEVADRPGFHYATWDDPFPKPTYLFALVAGDLRSLDDSFVTRSGRRVLLQIFSTPANLSKCKHAMASIKRAMRWDEERFGREYDLERFMIFCADDFNMGAMENKGLNIFNSKLVLADPQSATDADFEAIEAVVGHEYFHNWSGNRVTCRDWFQLSLKEGLTVFRDQEFSSDVGSRAVQRIRAVHFLRANQFPEDTGPMAHSVRPESYVEIANFYTTTVYEKGAELIRMQHALLGEAAFRRGTDLYFDRHDGQAVTCDDFVQAMQDASGIDLGQFKRWYAQAGTPELAIAGRHDPSTQTYTLEVEQSCSATPGQPQKDPFHIPLAVGLIDRHGRALPLYTAGNAPTADMTTERATDGAADAATELATEMPSAIATEVTTGFATQVLHVRERHQSFCFEQVATVPVPSLLRAFSAPVRIRFDYSRDELALLAMHDTDAVSRWNAAQRIWCETIVEQAARHRRSDSLALDPILIDVVRSLLDDDASDPALRALALAPPEFSVLAEEATPIDFDGLHASLRFVVHSLATELHSSLFRAYREQAVTLPYAPDTGQIAQRSLRNRCLWFLAAIDDEEGRATARKQFDAADNMTDAIAALIALNDSAGVERGDVFARFEMRWRNDALVMDKWFALQATRDAGDTLRRVQELRRHPCYHTTNPNRVRALIGSFALRNWPRFHEAGDIEQGAAYAFLADQVVEIDRLNPQMAARLASAFSRWRRFDATRARLQQAALQRIAAVPDLSVNVAEIVGKSLAE